MICFLWFLSLVGCFFVDFRLLMVFLGLQGAGSGLWGWISLGYKDLCFQGGYAGIRAADAHGAGAPDLRSPSPAQAMFCFVCYGFVVGALLLFVLVVVVFLLLFS